MDKVEEARKFLELVGMPKTQQERFLSPHFWILRRTRNFHSHWRGRRKSGLQKCRNT